MKRKFNPGGEPGAGQAPPAAAQPPPDGRVITTVSMPRPELERLDGIAAALGVDRNRLVRALALMAAYEPPEKLRGWLARLPRAHGWGERLLHVLTPETYLTLAEIRAALGARPESWHPALDGLVAEGLVDRQGRGVRASPLRFRRTPRAEREMARRQRAGYERAAAARLRERGY